tara:strand:- start:106 stop:888 length:783 start_codon:yes stop_codon:yes gene_type:complete
MIKYFLIFLIIFSFTISNVDAIPLSDKTGLKFSFPIQTDNRNFTIEGTGNLQISNLIFDKEEKAILLQATSSIENNLLEIIIPKSLIGGDFSFYLDDNEIFPEYQQGKNLSFVIIEFGGIGNHEIKLQGTTYLDIFNVENQLNFDVSNGIIDSVEANPSTNSLIFSLLNTTSTGQLSLNISDDVIIPFENNEFVVIVDGSTSDYSFENNEILKIPFNPNTNKIVIYGTYVIPEFYEIAPLILATSFIVLIILKKHSKLFI